MKFVASYAFLLGKLNELKRQSGSGVIYKVKIGTLEMLFVLDKI